MVTKVRGSFREFEGSITIGDDTAASTAQATHRRPRRSTPAPRTVTSTWSPATSSRSRSSRRSPSATPRSSSQKGTDFKVTGDLTIKGVTREVTLDVELDGVAKDPWGNEKLAVTASTEIDREDFGMTWNVALETGGVLVSKKVIIEIEAQAARQA